MKTTRILRQIKKEIEIYKYDIKVDKLGVRDECDKYLIYLDSALHSELKAVMKELKEQFEYWSSLNVSLWKSDDNFLKKYFGRIVCEGLLKRISKDIHNAEVYQRDISEIRNRLNQIKYLL